MVRYCGGNGNGDGDGDGSGVWQKRWFYVNNEFMIYKKDQKAGGKDVKGAIDLSEVEAVEVSPKRDIDVVSAEERRRRRRRGCVRVHWRIYAMLSVFVVVTVLLWL